jgi:uncharacterized membrane protein YgdD (TMEM256/DUF423 family)
MTSKTVFWGAIIAGLAVLLGAFGAHALKGRLEPSQLETFETGVRYQMYHALAIIITGMYYRVKPSKRLENAVIAFYLGVILFSGSLYLLTISQLTRFDFKYFGAITPLGGICLIAGWAQLAWGAAARKG